MSDVPLDRFSIDVGEVLQHTVTSLYAHLVTRPTGRAVRMAIETRLQGAGHRSLSLIDFSEVVIIDFSCADEVVAKLLQRYSDDEVHDAFFIFSGVSEPHRDQVETVLERQGLAAVVTAEPGAYELIGVRSDAEASAWSTLEELGRWSRAKSSDSSTRRTGAPGCTLSPTDRWPIAVTRRGRYTHSVASSAISPSR